MASLTLKLLSSLAAVCAAARSTSTEPTAYALELLRLARSEAAAMTPCGPSAEDAAMEATLRILQRHPDVLLGNESRRRSYVKTSVRNALRDDRRRLRNTRRFSELEEADGPALSIPAPSADVEPLAALAADEFRAGLAAGDREILELLEDGERERGIAERTGRTRHEVRSSLMRIRRDAERYFGVGVGSSR